MDENKIKEVENKIHDLVEEYYNLRFKNLEFKPGETLVHPSGKLFNEKEMKAGVSAVLDGWWTEGRFAKEFEKEFAKYLGVTYAHVTNSGSSANLVALS